MKKILLLISALVFVWACGNDLKKEESNLADAINALHDSTMQQMETLMTMQEQIKTAMKTDSSQKTTADSLVYSLGAADNAMMDWMKDFDPAYISAGHTHEEVMKYLKAQQESILKVKEQTDLSINNTKLFLKK
jgi:hypothetical protein